LNKKKRRDVENKKEVLELSTIFCIKGIRLEITKLLVK